jgi:hypothetical protein
MHRLAAHLTVLERLVGEALQAIEAVTGFAQIVVDRHRSHSISGVLPERAAKSWHSRVESARHS